MYKTLPRVAILAAVAFWLATAMSARADIIFQLGNHPQKGEQNILLQPPDQMGSTIHGITDQSGTIVDFSSTTDILENPSNGQAQILAEDGAINNITVSVPGHTFTDLIFDLQIGKLGSST